MARIPDEFLDALKERIDITTFIEGYVPLKKSGRMYKGLCPFHNEKTPSFMVYPESQSFYCFGCQKGGDLITFTEEIEHLDYPDAVQFLADKAGLNMPDTDYDDTLSKKRQRIYAMNKAAARFFYENLKTPEGQRGLQYWTGRRRLTPETIRHFGLGYALDDWHALLNHLRSLGYSYEEAAEADLAKKSTKNGRVNFYDNFRGRAMVPIIDLRGNIVGFGGRVLDDSKPKYVNTSDTLVYKKSNQVFALNFAKQSGKDSLILCEGYLDVIALHQAGFTNAVAGLGTALTPEQVRLITRYCQEVYLSYDNDEAGQNAMNRAISLFKETGLPIHTLTLSGGKDPDEILQKYGRERFQAILDGAVNDVEYALSNLRQKYDTKTADGQNRYLREAVRFLVTNADESERIVYTSRIAEEIGVSPRDVETYLRDELEKNERKKKAQQKTVDFGAMKNAFDQYRTPATGADPKTLQARRAEETILAAIMHNPDYYKSLCQTLSAGDFSDDFGRRLYTILGERIQNDQPVEPMYLSSEFSPDEMGQIARITQGEASRGSIPPGVVTDCIAVIKDRKAREERSDPADLSDEEYRRLFRKQEW